MKWFFFYYLFFNLTMSKIWCHSCFFALQRGRPGMSSVPVHVHVVMSVCVSVCVWVSQRWVHSLGTLCCSNGLMYKSTKTSAAMKWAEAQRHAYSLLGNREIDCCSDWQPKVYVCVSVCVCVCVLNRKRQVVMIAGMHEAQIIEVGTLIFCL